MRGLYFCGDYMALPATSGPSDIASLQARVRLGVAPAGTDTRMALELEAERVGGMTRPIRREAVARAARERSEQEQE